MFCGWKSILLHVLNARPPWIPLSRHFLRVQLFFVWKPLVPPEHANLQAEKNFLVVHLEETVTNKARVNRAAKQSDVDFSTSGYAYLDVE